MSGDPVAFNNTSAVDICSCVYLITYQALHSPTFRPHALLLMKINDKDNNYYNKNTDYNIIIKNDSSSSTTTKRYSDNVFCLLYSDKKNLLDLYNALNNSSHTDTDNLSITTLKGGVYMKYKNDASFVFSYELYMFEQQSSLNFNMPLRFLHYGSEVYRNIFPNNMLHKRSMLKIPTPHFITFYNGRERMKERIKILKLSDMFEHPTKHPELELIVTVINLNPAEETTDIIHSTTDDNLFDNNTRPAINGLFTDNILNRCKSLRDYMTFVTKVRNKMDLSGLDVRASVIEAVDECIKEDILSDFFIKHREEVIDVSIFEYDEEGVMEILREEARTAGLEEGRAAGLEEGRAAGLEEGRSAGLKEGRSAGLEEGHIAAIKNIMTKLGKSADEAMDILDIDIDKREVIKKKLQ